MRDASPDALPGGDARAGAGVPHDWETALLVAVPEAEPAVGEHRARLDSSARDGVPAHLTVLYPFLPPASIDGAVLASLRRLFARFPAFDVTLDRVSWFDADVVWLGPRDDRPFRALISGAFAAFPDCPPYGGLIAEVIPHLTIGDRDDRPALRAAAEAVRGHLPVEAKVTEVTLMAGPAPGNVDIPPGQWRTLAAFPLSARARLAPSLRPVSVSAESLTSWRCLPLGGSAFLVITARSEAQRRAQGARRSAGRRARGRASGFIRYG